MIVAEESEKYAVYSAVINDYYLKKNASIKLFLISNQTSFYGTQPESAFFGDDFMSGMSAEQRVSNLKKIALTVSAETLFDYDRKQMESYKLYPKFDFTFEYMLVKKDDFEKYGAGRKIEFSSVGFNKTGDQAFLFTRVVCHALCGSSDHVLLEKVEGRWRIKEIFEGIRS